MTVSIDRNIDPRGDIAVVTVDNPPVNALSRDVRDGLWNAVGVLEDDPTVRGVVLICAGRTFIAGADVREFGQPPQTPHLPDLIARIEASTKPWCAAIHGTALGGGFEIAMGCRFRVASVDARIGLPEVTLGIIPGAGGTVRTPRLAGVSVAVELATSGKPIGARAACDAGLIDLVAPGDVLPAAVEFLRAALDQPLPAPVSQRPVPPPEPGFWDTAEKAVRKAAKGATAPLRALESIRFAAESDAAAAFAHERAIFFELRGSDESAALRRIFFAERAAPRPAALKGVTPRPIRHAGVIGGGTMGAGIAVALLAADIPVTLIERDQDALDRGMLSIRRTLDTDLARGRITDTQHAERLDNLTPTSDYAALADVDLVIEAVFEDLAIKRGVFAALSAACRADAVLATNTSYLDPRAIADGTANPERVIGLHFFSPANIMKLLEIVPTPDTAPDVLATGFALAAQLGKIPVQAGICDGFIGNRILKRYRGAAEALVRDGVPPAQVDAAMRDFGMAMGPFQMSDLAGLDIAWLQRKGARDRGEVVAPMLADLLVEAGRKGQKTGAGWYDYAQGDRTPRPSPAVTALLASHVAPDPGMDKDSIASRLIAEMGAEGQAILDEGIANSATDIDLVEIHGYGFPRWRGGPMFLREKALG